MIRSRAAEARRYSWNAGAGHRSSSGASLVVEGAEFPVEIYETVERRPYELTVEERAKKARGQYYWARTHDYFGTNRFSLRRGEWDQYLKDTKHQKVEERLNDFFASIIHRAFEARERDRQRKIEENGRRAALHGGPRLSACRG